MGRVLSLPVRRPWLTVLGWLVVLAATNVAGRIVHPPAMSRSFLPADAESQRASALDSAKFTDGHQSVQLVIVDADGLRDSDRALATQLGGWLTSRSRTLDVLTVSRPYPSPDGRALVMQVTFRSTGPAPDGPDPRIAAIEEHLSSLAVPGSVSVAVTGDLAISHDINAGIMDSD